MSLKKNDEITLEITAMTSQGSGLGHFEKLAVFVEGAVTGDKLLVHIIKVKSNYAVGIIKKIIKIKLLIMNYLKNILLMLKIIYSHDLVMKQ